MPKLRSSNIDAAEYDAETGTLSVTFRSGATYTYLGVDEALYQDLLTSESPGSYLARHIKDRHEYTKS